METMTLQVVCVGGGGEGTGLRYSFRCHISCAPGQELHRKDIEIHAGIYQLDDVTFHLPNV